MCRSIWIDGIATLTIATSRMVMKNAAPTIARVSQRRSDVSAVIWLLRLLRWRTTNVDGLFPALAGRAGGGSGQGNAVSHSRQRHHPPVRPPGVRSLRG